MTTVNFFWRGKHTFGFFQQIVIESHIKVGHKPIFWLSGEMPEGENWEKIEKKVTVKTTDNLFFNEDEFARDSIPTILGDMWKFHLYHVSMLPYRFHPLPVSQYGPQQRADWAVFGQV